MQTLSLVLVFGLFAAMCLWFNVWLVVAYVAAAALHLYLEVRSFNKKLKKLKKVEEELKEKDPET